LQRFFGFESGRNVLDSLLGAFEYQLPMVIQFDFLRLPKRALASDRIKGDPRIFQRLILGLIFEVGALGLFVRASSAPLLV